MFALKKPCVDCPFRKTGGIRLNRERAREIAGYFIDRSQASTFPCHRTVDYDAEADAEDDESADGPATRASLRMDWQMCAGGMIFADKVGTFSTMMQLGIRLGLMKIDDLEDRDGIVDSLDELVSLSYRR